MLITELAIGRDAFVFPTLDGINGQIMQTNGSGVLTWVDNLGENLWDRDSTGFINPSIDGDTLRIYDSIGVDYVEISHDGTNSIISPVGDLSITGNILLENSGMIANKKNINVDIGSNVIDSFADTLGEGCVWHLVCIKGANRRVGTFMTTWNASTNDIEYANVSTKDIGTVDLEFTTNISSENVRLLATATSDDWEVRVIRQII